MAKPHHQLRRDDHGIEDRATIEALLESALVGRVGVVANDEPYVVPMNFAYADSKIYIHGANSGRLIEAVQSNPQVCFEIDEYVATLPHPVLCDFDTAYASVICYGTARVLEELSDRTSCLKLIARKYAPQEHADALRESTVEGFRGTFESKTAVIEISVDSMTAKKQDFIIQDFSHEENFVVDSEDLGPLGNVPAEYKHYQSATSYHKPLILHGAILKWYDIRKPELIIPMPFIKEARAFIESQAKSGEFELGYGLGFCMLHYTAQMAYLSVCVWKNNQELWEALYTRDVGDAASDFRRIQLGIDGPTYCAWDLVIVEHERAAWVEYLNSGRDELAKRAYLVDQYSGLD